MLVVCTSIVMELWKMCKYLYNHRDAVYYTYQKTGNRYYFSGPLGEAVTGKNRIDGRDFNLA